MSAVFSMPVALSVKTRNALINWGLHPVTPDVVAGYFKDRPAELIERVPGIGKKAAAEINNWLVAHGEAPIRKGAAVMTEFKTYRRRNLAEIRPYIPGESMDGVSIAAVDSMAGSPKEGDMVARNPDNHADQWLLAKKYFEDNFELDL